MCGRSNIVRNQTIALCLDSVFVGCNPLAIVHSELWLSKGARIWMSHFVCVLESIQKHKILDLFSFKLYVATTLSTDYSLE